MRKAPDHMTPRNGQHRAFRTVCRAFVLALAVSFSGCALWNPFGYSEDWPWWKKTLFFAGPGHCPVCYCVGGAIAEVARDDTPPSGNKEATEQADGRANHAAQEVTP